MLDEPTLITVGMIHSGNYMINIPEDLEMQGSIRCLHNGEEAAVHAWFREIVESVCKTHRCTCEISITCGNHLLSNDHALYNIVCAASEETLGENRVTADGVREMGEDDLTEFFRAGIPGCYYLIGMGNEAKGSTVAHHNKNFLADEDVIGLGAELQTRVVLRYLAGSEQQ